MIFAAPEATPVTMPEVEPTVAIPVLLLLHVPPVVPSPNVVVAPTHAEVLPVIASNGVTVTIIEALQPLLGR